MPDPSWKQDYLALNDKIDAFLIRYRRELLETADDTADVDETDHNVRFLLGYSLTRSSELLVATVNGGLSDDADGYRAEVGALLLRKAARAAAPETQEEEQRIINKAIMGIVDIMIHAPTDPFGQMDLAVSAVAAFICQLNEVDEAHQDMHDRLTESVETILKKQGRLGTRAERPN